MDRMHMAMAILISVVITFGLRALPFFVFKRARELPEALVRLGERLPVAIMAVLIVYCMRSFYTEGVSNAVAVGVPAVIVAGSYLWKENTFLSIAAGTVCHMILLRM